MSKVLRESRKGIAARNVSFRADEKQALLRACIAVGVEEARRAGRRTEHLFFDVQKLMSNYGHFPNRKLYILSKYYQRMEKDFRSGKLNPHPPEARQLWGSDEHQENASKNDDKWETLIKTTLERKRTCSYLLKCELKEIIKQALGRKIESIVIKDRTTVFQDMLIALHSKKMFLNRDVKQLQQAYFRLKRQFEEGRSKNFPPEASTLWRRPNTIELEASRKAGGGDVETESRSAGVKEMIKTNECRICQAHLFSRSKDLFLDTYNNQTYGEIIHDTIHVKIDCDDQMNTTICWTCSVFIENLQLFVHQCHETFKFQKNTVPEMIKSDNELAEHSDENIQIEYLHEALDDENDNYFMLDHKVYNEKNHSSTEDEVEDSENINTEEQKHQMYIKSKPKSNRKKQCHLCGKSIYDLSNHLTSHKNAEFPCEFCPRVCPNQRQLRVHRNIHTKENAFPCRYCDKVFYVWTTRKNHELSHRNVKFNCDKCDAVYAKACQLRSHVKQKHLGIRNLQCTTCDFRTFLKTRLLNHVRSIHTTERPYKCVYCDHTSNSSTGYYIHFQRHKKSGEATEYSIKCTYCGMQFFKDVALERHVRSDHPDKAVVV
ncbi:zinc finger protein 808-like [Malaya genurostris]|uniref:zinc finger protein 808-like n=1 Tax=Malaya genurostris TaxID=325434 RepID=UPI0026F3E8DD|nr:zinc finger protein 808-like [Malaya genurostris]